MRVSKLAGLFLIAAVSSINTSVVFGQTRTVTTTTTTKTTVTTKVHPNLSPKPVTNSKQKSLEMVFVLDTTGSMGGLIEGAKQKIWSIVNDVMQKKDRPSVKIGLVAYRDVGDAYVTQVTPLSDDLDKVYSTLMDFRAEGGGDTPENVRRALAEGVDKAGWTKANNNTAQILFLVGDAPPHDDYPQEIDVLTTTAKAVSQNMIVNTIQCGDIAGTREVWQKIALRGEGKYFAIAQNGGVQAIATPYDARLAELGAKIGATYLAYSGKGATIDGKSVAELPVNGREFRELQMSAQVQTESKMLKSAPTTAQADRAVNKAINSLSYQSDLLQAVENQTVKLEEIKKEDLPDSLQKLSPAELKAEVDKRIAERKQIRAEIMELSKKRDDFIKAERAKIGKQDGFDSAVSNALSEQMLRKGIN